MGAARRWSVLVEGTLLVGALALSLTVGLAPPVAADPAYPSAEEIQRSQQKTQDKTAAVATIEGRLAKANVVARGLAIDAEQAAEAYNGALYKLSLAQRAADGAERRATDTRRKMEEANIRKGQLAAASYRMGGLLDGYAALLNADGPVTAMQQAATLEYLGQQTEAVLDDARATDALAVIMNQRASVALDAQRVAVEAVRTAKQEAEAAVAAQQKQIDQITVIQNAMLAELAAVRQTTVALERARERGIEEEAARRAAAAQQAAAIAAGGGNRPDGSSQGTTTGAAQAIAFARAQLGKPYIWATAGPGTFDCSGLTMMAWRAAGVSLPHYSVAQYEQVRHVSLGDLRPGDLIFWTRAPGDPGGIYHVALYIGNDLMIQAPHTGDVVKISSIYVMGTPDFYGRP